MTRALAFFVLGVIAVSALADSSITYQGRLDHSGAPFTGSANLQFALYNAESGCCQVGPIIYRDDWPVVDGLFQVELDLGDTFPAPRWLEVRVNGTLMNPRQGIRPTPMAIRSLRPWQSSGNDASIDGNVSVSADLEVSGKTSLSELQLPGGMVNLTRAPRVVTTGRVGGWVVPTACPTAGGTLRELDVVVETPALVFVTASGIFNNTGSSSSNGSVYLRQNGQVLIRLHYQGGSGWEAVTVPWFGVVQPGTHKFTLTTDAAVGACNNSGQYGRIDAAILE